MANSMGFNKTRRFNSTSRAPANVKHFLGNRKASDPNSIGHVVDTRWDKGKKIGLNDPILHRNTNRFKFSNN